MTYKEAQELAMKVRWKTEECFSGSDCWCELIVPETDIIDDDGNKICIIPTASVLKNVAKYIVELHNKNIEK